MTKKTGRTDKAEHPTMEEVGAMIEEADGDILIHDIISNLNKRNAALTKKVAEANRRYDDVANHCQKLKAEKEKLEKRVTEHKTSHWIMEERYKKTIAAIEGEVKKMKFNKGNCHLCKHGESVCEDVICKLDVLAIIQKFKEGK